MIECDITAERGVVRVSGLVPNGSLQVTREAPGYPPFLLRNGTLIIDDEGFSLEDTEPPIGVPLKYTALSTPTDRIAQQNYALTPDFTHGLQSWTAGANRTIAVFPTTPGDTKVHAEVSPNTAGTTAGIPGRTIGETGIGTLTSGTTYLVTGKVRFRTPNVWTWNEVKAFGTWAALKAAKATWADVRATAFPTTDVYQSLWISLSSGTTDYVAPIQVLQVPVSGANSWATFAAYVTVPTTMPVGATPRLRLLHGTNAREYAITWDLSEFSISTQDNALSPYRLEWFSGDSAVPSRPQDYLMQDSTWENISGDARILWTGLAGNSVSRFLAPSQISTSGFCQLEPPSSNIPCEPVLLSDPVNSALSQWFGLSQIDTLSREARASVLAVLDRSDYINSSSRRGAYDGTLILFTDTLEQRKQAWSVFDSGRVLLLRNPDPSFPETMWYIACGNIDEDRTLPDARRPERTWKVPFVQVERPTGLIEASTGVTWSQLKDSGQTWNDVRMNYPNWLEVILEAP